MQARHRYMCWVTGGVEAVAVVGEAGAGDAVVAGVAVGRQHAAELDQLLDRRQETVSPRVGDRRETDAAHPAAALLDRDQHRRFLCRSAPVLARRDAADIRLVDLDLARRGRAAPSPDAACAAATTPFRSCRGRAPAGARARSPRAWCRSHTRPPQTRSKAEGACPRRSSPRSPTRRSSRPRSADSGPCSSARSAPHRTSDRRTRPASATARGSRGKPTRQETRR